MSSVMHVHFVTIEVHGLFGTIVDRLHPKLSAGLTVDDKPEMSKLHYHNIVIFGIGGVGKTCLWTRFCRNYFIEGEAIDPYSDGSYRRQIIIDDAPCLLEILEITGEEEYTAMRNEWIRCGNAFMLAFSISSRYAFSQIKTFAKQIQDVKNETVPLILIGTKSDLEFNWRQVRPEEGTALAKELECQFIETSAKDGTNVEKAFCDLIRTSRRLEKQQRSRSESALTKEIDSPAERKDQKKSWRIKLSRLLGLPSLGQRPGS